MEDDFILIPGETTLFRTHDVPPVPIRLPLQASARRKSMWRIGAFTGFGGITCLLGAVALAVGSMNEPGLAINVALLLVFVLGCLYFGCYFMAMAISCAAELLYPSPPLIVGRSGLSEGRTRIFVPWPSVVSVRPMMGRRGVAAVRLVLRVPVETSYNPFRYGSPGLFRRRKPNELHVPVVALDVDARLLAESLVYLVRANGGLVEPAQLLV